MMCIIGLSFVSEVLQHYSVDVIYLVKPDAHICEGFLAPGGGWHAAQTFIPHIFEVAN